MILKLFIGLGMKYIVLKELRFFGVYGLSKEDTLEIMFGEGEGFVRVWFIFYVFIVYVWFYFF